MDEPPVQARHSHRRRRLRMAGRERVAARPHRMDQALSRSVGTGRGPARQQRYARRQEAGAVRRAHLFRQRPEQGRVVQVGLIHLPGIRRHAGRGWASRSSTRLRLQSRHRDHRAGGGGAVGFQAAPRTWISSSPSATSTPTATMCGKSASRASRCRLPKAGCASPTASSTPSSRFLTGRITGTSSGSISSPARWCRSRSRSGRPRCVFRKGHRIRLDVQPRDGVGSVHYTHYHADYNTGSNTIHAGGEHESLPAAADHSSRTQAIMSSSELPPQGGRMALSSMS